MRLLRLCNFPNLYFFLFFQVLSSRIMPVDFPTDRPTQFCEDFMSGNGLSLILQIFQVDYFPVEVENEVRQACYSLALQLIS